MVVTNLADNKNRVFIVTMYRMAIHLPSVRNLAAIKTSGWLQTQRRPTPRMLREPTPLAECPMRCLPIGQGSPKGSW